MWNYLTYDNSSNLAWNQTNFTIFYDVDGDGIPNFNDTLEGNFSTVNTTGVTNLNITIGGAQNSTYSGIQEVRIQDGGTTLVNFTYNFSLADLDLRLISITVAPMSIVINLSGQLLLNKSIYLADSRFAGICVKDAEIASVSAINAGCNGDNETSFDACIGNSAGITINGITCTDEGSRIRVDNLRFSGVRGSAAPSPGGSTEGGGGGGGNLRAVPSGGTTVLSSSRIEKGYSVRLSKDSSVRFPIDSELHLLKLEAIENTNAVVEISSSPITARFALNEKKKFELTNDDFFDLEATLTEITKRSATFLIKRINEKIISGKSPAPQVKQTNEANSATSKNAEPIAKQKTNIIPLKDDVQTGSPYRVIGLIAVIVAISLVLFRKVIKKKRG